MADTKRSSLTKSSITEARNQRLEAPVQPGASGNEVPLSAEEALKVALHHHGKTRKHTKNDNTTKASEGK
jgi:hypothetical protein